MNIIKERTAQQTAWHLEGKCKFLITASMLCLGLGGVWGHGYKRESSVTQMMCNPGWQSLKVRRAVSCLSMMYKIVHGLVDVESQLLVRSGCATRQFQGENYFRNILVLKSCYKASFFPHNVPEWNHLPLHIWNASFIDCFKSSLM